MTLEQTKQENIKDDVLIEAQDKLLSQNFLTYQNINQTEINSLYWQIESINDAIDFKKLRKYSYLRLKNSKKDKYPNLIIDLDDEVDGIYKQIKISTDNLTIEIEQCKNLANGYYIFENIKFYNEYETYITRTLLKTKYPNNVEFIPLSKKEWLYNGKEKKIEMIDSIDYTKYNIEKIREIEKIEKHTKTYIKCLKRNTPKK